MTRDSTPAGNQVLERMQVPGRSHLYVLGCFESRITLYTQQVRALNLIYALSDGFKKSGTRVAVIGAGAGGLTAAAAAGVCGCRVSVFEMYPNPLDLIGPSHLRWLHPHIYEWPKPGSENSRAGLPLLDWTEGLAFEVVAKLLPGWAALAKAYNIELHCGIRNLGVDRTADGKYLLRWNGEGPSPPSNALSTPSGRGTWGSRSGSRMRIQPFDIVILAVGFGVETANNQFPMISSYWYEDNINRDDRFTSKPVSRVLISGTGDGGLIDLLRYSFRHFRHERILTDFQNNWLSRPGDMDRIKEKIIEIEKHAWSLFKVGQPYAAYLNLSYRDLADSLVLKADIPIRKNIQPVLTGKGALPLNLQSAPINRFLFSLTNAEYIPGPIVSTQCDQNGKNCEVTFADGLQDKFDEVVIRHGPTPAVKKYFPEIWELCAGLRENARALPDPTREPLDYRQFYEERLALNTELLKPEPPARSAEEIERAIPVVPPPTEDRPEALERYRETLIDDALQLAEGE
jgi:hypothetical protein